MQSEEVRAFKNELRNYNFYLSRIVTLENSIEFCYDRLGGVRGIDPSKEPTHSMPNKELEWQLRDKIESLDAEKRVIETKVKYIESILAKIETSLREVIIAVYCENKTMQYVAIKNNISTSGLNKRMIVGIKKALN